MINTSMFAALLMQLMVMNPSTPLKLTGQELYQLQCLTAGVYYEMRNRNEAVQIGVAYTIKNRLRRPQYAKTYCGVIVQPSQFRDNWRSQKRDADSGPLWGYAAKVALVVHFGLVDDPTNGATSFCTRHELAAKSPATRKAVSWCKTDGVWIQDVKFVDPDRKPDMVPYSVLPPSRHPSARKTVDQLVASLS